tara:strand:+ start:2241 stop:3056 length:816 start_codon:yes stop_codon:yes gene_type:complete
MQDSKKFAVIGSPIRHSLSPKIHQIFASKLGIEISYQALPIEPEKFETSVKKLFDEGYDGLNVTLPLKELAYRYADKQTQESEMCKSVNTLWKEGSSIMADSTDGRGLLKDLNNKRVEVQDKEIVILGAGGSAKAIIPSLLKANPKRITICNRTISKAEMLAKEYVSFDIPINIISMSSGLDFNSDLVINTTSAGVLDQGLAIPNNLFTEDTCVYDLSYSKTETPFIQMAKRFEVQRSYDGLGMLINQAALSFAIWTGQIPETDMDIDEIL